MQALEKHDMQGLIVRGYGKLPAARYLLCRIADAGAAKPWLATLHTKVTPGDQSPDDQAMHVAFTSEGIRQLNVPADVLASFAREWLEGMTLSPRSYHLGDENANDPAHWAWGGPNTDAVHLMLMCYAKDAATLDQQCNNLRTEVTAAGIVVMHEMDTTGLPEEKEHFGFRDGVSQPIMKGLSRKDLKKNPVNAGEFVLGYPNAYDRYTESPQVSPAQDPDQLLPVNPEDPGKRDLGKNGSYLVYRQMSQDVYGFWKYLHEQSKEPASDKLDAAVRLGAKMVGRWPGGAPLVNSPDSDDPAKAKDNDFGYWEDDPKGTKCPFGSHIRRTNPRDWLFTERQQFVSEEMVGKHHLLRRGRSYGAPLAPSMKPADVLAAGDDGQARGLHFICLVGSLNRQFEFVQNVWVKTPTFAGLYKDGDPIIGTRQGPGEQLTDEFTCPAKPFRRKYKGMPQFVTVVGGAYFFLPGIAALRYLSSF